MEGLLASFPSAVHGFHFGNGSEYVNHQVAALLEKLRVEGFTKSRPRRSNDNALAESKYGSVIRKQFGYGHIPGRHVDRPARFHREVLDPYLNYYRPCPFPRVATDVKEGHRKADRQADIRTPASVLSPPLDRPASPDPTCNFGMLRISSSRAWVLLCICLAPICHCSPRETPVPPVPAFDSRNH